MEKSKYKPEQQEVKEGKAECYWCDGEFPIEQMTEDRQYGVKVYVCSKCKE